MNTSQSSSSNDSSSCAGGVAGTMFLLPLAIVAVYAYVDKALVGQAVANLLGAGGVATAVTNAFWVVGCVMVALLAVFAIITVGGLIIGAIRRSATAAGFGIAGVGFFVASYGVAVGIFSSLPLLVGFYLAAFVVVNAVLIVALVVGGLIALTVV